MVCFDSVLFLKQTDHSSDAEALLLPSISVCGHSTKFESDTWCLYMAHCSIRNSHGPNPVAHLRSFIPLYMESPECRCTHTTRNWLLKSDLSRVVRHWKKLGFQWRFRFWLLRDLRSGPRSRFGPRVANWTVCYRMDWTHWHRNFPRIHSLVESYQSIVPGSWCSTVMGNCVRHWDRWPKRDIWRNDLFS